MSSIKYLLVMLFSIAVVACGGGGGGSSAPATYAISGTITGASGVVAVGLSGTSTASTNAAANGTYSFTGLANGSYTVTPTLAGYAFTPTSTAVTVSGANVTGKNFTATAAATTYTISGSSGIAGATITLSGTNSGTLTAGTGGAYAFSGMVNGNYTVTPSLTGYTFAPTSASVTINNANATAATFVPTAIPVAHTLSGNVSPSLAGVTIAVTGTATASTTTDASGNYSFTGATGLYDGTYTVTPTRTGYTFAPNSTSVTMAGANLTGKNFTGTANSAVTATANGTVTGAWVQGVTITLSGGGQSGTTTTNASGNYSFANLPSAQTYTFTPTLAGYTFGAAPTAAISAGSSTAVTVTAITATSAITSYSVSGTLTNNSTAAGGGTIRVFNSGCTTYNNCQIVAAAHFASLAVNGSVNYTIRGLQPGNYVVKAGIGVVSSGWPNASNPTSGLTAFTIASANVNGVNVSMADVTAPTPTAPTSLSVLPGNTAAFIQYNPFTNANGAETATSYKIYWGTDAAATNGSSSPVTFTAQGLNQTFYFLKGLPNGAMNFKMTALVGATESAATAVVAATIGTPSGGNAVSGTVTCTACPALSATTPMMVGVYDQTNGIAYFTTIASPNSSQAYTISGVPIGTNYFPFAIIDMNNNGRVDIGDISNTNGDGASIAVSGNLANTNIALTTASATVDVYTGFWSDGTSSGYNSNLSLNDGTKRMVNATLFSGPHVAVPADLSVYGGNWTNLPITGTPAVGDSYQLQLTFSDGTTQNMTGTVTGVLGVSNLPTNLGMVTTGSYTRNIPQFTWGAPASAPTATPYTYGVNLYGTNDSTNWYPNGDLLSNTFSALYNYDGSATSASLTTGNNYIWQVQVRDANRNSATLQAPAYVP